MQVWILVCRRPVDDATTYATFPTTQQSTRGLRRWAAYDPQDQANEGPAQSAGRSRVIRKS
jgi:hypothetical protein